MENKIRVVVADRIFHLSTADKEEYVLKVASYVDDRVMQLAEASHASTLDAGIMAALDIADSYFKEQEAAEHLRKQVKEYADEAARLKAELSRLQGRGRPAAPAQPEPQPPQARPEAQPKPEQPQGKPNGGQGKR